MNLQSLLSRLLSLVLLPAGPASLLGLEGRQRGKVDLLLGDGSNQELVGIDQILADFDVPLMDQNSRLMDGLGLESLLVDSGLQSLIEELVDGQTQHVIQLQLLVGEQTISMHSVQQCSSLE